MSKELDICAQSCKLKKKKFPIDQRSEMEYKNDISDGKIRRFLQIFRNFKCISQMIKCNLKILSKEIMSDL